MENIIINGELLEDPDFIWTEDGTVVCATLYSVFLKNANEWFEAED